MHPSNSGPIRLGRLIVTAGLSAVLIVAAGSGTDASVRPPKLDYTMATLPNGLQVVFLEDHSTPIVHTEIWYHVGSKNEKPGHTGFAHLFEHMIGAPVFKPGDEAFLFLKSQGAGMPYVFGLNQGVFRVNVDQRGVRKVVSPLLLASGTDPEVVRRGAVNRQPLALETFGEQIRTAMAAGRAGAR